MDDLAEALGGLIIGIAIAVAVIIFIVYVVIPCAIIYFIGRTFYRQLKTYKLVRITQLVLTLIGGISIVISTAIVGSAGWNGLLVIPISLILFMTLSVLTLGLWAFSKKVEFLKTRYLIKLEKIRGEQRIKMTRKRLESLDRYRHRLKSKNKELIRHGEKLNNNLKELCMTDAQSYTIKLKEWQEEIDMMQIDEMTKLKEELIRELKRHKRTDTDNKNKMVENSIKLCLLKQKEIEIMPYNPFNAIKRTSEEIEELQRELSFLERVRTNLDSKYHENEMAYKRLLSSGIVLD